MGYPGIITIMIYVRTWIHTLNNVRFLVINMSNEIGHPITWIKKLHPFGGIYRLLPTFYTRTYIWFTNSIVSSIDAGNPINSWNDIFLQLPPAVGPVGQSHWYWGIKYFCIINPLFLLLLFRKGNGGTQWGLRRPMSQWYHILGGIRENPGSIG